MSAKPNTEDLLVTVCDACFCASCWQGIFLCDKSRDAGTVDLPIRKLRELNREHPSYYVPKVEW